MRSGLIARFLAIFLIAFLASGCVSTRTEKRSQTIKVNTNPPGAQVWVEDKTGQRVIGTSPTSVIKEYEFKISDFDEWWWSIPVSSAIVMVIGGVLFGLSDGIESQPDRDLTYAGIPLMAVGGLGVLAGSIVCGIGQSKQGEDFETVRLVTGASLPGYESSSKETIIPYEYSEINLLLPKSKAPAVAASPAAAPVKGPDPKREIVAVFDVQDTTGRIGKKDLESLTNYLGTVLAQSGKYQIVPRDQLRARLFEEKKGTYKACYEESCQIELGKELSAQKTLATTLIRVGTKCAVTSNLFNLKTVTAEKGASVNTGCATDELLDAMKQIAEQLSK